jgi:ketosteroid isomerase-like protein
MAMHGFVRGLLIVGFPSWMAAGCAGPGNAFTPQDEAAIRAAGAEYARLETPADAEKWAAISATDAVMMPAGEKPVQGRDALIAWVRRVPSGLKLNIVVHEIVGHGSTAIERGSYAVSGPAPAGATPQSDTGSYLVVWERQANGRWLVTRNIWNSDRP